MNSPMTRLSDFPSTSGNSTCEQFPRCMHHPHGSSNSLQMRIKFPCWSIAEPGIEWETTLHGRRWWWRGDGGCATCYLLLPFPLLLLPSWQFADRVQQRRKRVAHPGNLQRKLSTVPIVCLGPSDAYHRHHKTIFYAACFGLEITPKGTAERARIAAYREEEMKEEKGRRREGSQQYERRFRSCFWNGIPRNSPRTDSIQIQTEHWRKKPAKEIKVIRYGKRKFAVETRATEVEIRFCEQRWSWDPSL